MQALAHQPEQAERVRPDYIETSAKGRWLTVPSLRVDDKHLTLRGRWLTIASVEAEEWLDSEVSDPDLCVRALREHTIQGRRADIFTFAQMVPGSPPKYGYHMESESIAVARTRAFQEWWESLPQETRKNVRRAQKRGVVVRVQELDDSVIRGIKGVNDDSRVRQGVPYAHYGKSLDQVKKDQSSYITRSDFICAYVGSEMVGFLKLVHRGEVASILQIVPKASHQDKRPANAMVAKAVEVCAAKGVRFLIYGKFNYGNKKESSLREFKERNGFEEILTPTYYVPLTLKGTLALRMKLHLGLHGILPHRVIAMAVAVRKRWYSLVAPERGRRSLSARPGGAGEKSSEE